MWVVVPMRSMVKVCAGAGVILRALRLLGAKVGWPPLSALRPHSPNPTHPTPRTL